MAFGGDDIDTLALMFDKLQYIFRGYDSYIETFTEMHVLHKQGKLTEREYYHGMTDAVLKYSALEFLGLKAMFEIKKALNRRYGRPMPSSSVSGMGSGNVTQNMIPGSQNTLASFITTKSLPARDEFVHKTFQNEMSCTSCGNVISMRTKFCPSCGNKT